MRASICIQAVSSHASAPRAHQIRFWAKSCSGRLVSPVCLAQRMRSSARARRRCRNSRSSSCPRRLLVAKAVTRSLSPVGDRQLRPWMRTFSAGDDSHARRPAGQVQQPGELGDPGPVADLIVGSWAGVHTSAGIFCSSSAVLSGSVEPIE